MAEDISYKVDPETTSRYYSPTSGQKTIDVVGKMPWTLSPQNSRKDVPKMKLKEYQQSTGQLMASIFYFSRAFKNIDSVPSAVDAFRGRADALDVYKDKYFGTETGFSYILPYFQEAHTTRTNDFSGENDNQMSKIKSILPTILTNSALGSLVGNIYSTAQGVQAAADVLMTGKTNFEFPERWNSTTNESYTTTFDLFNTTTLEDVKANRKFCHLISYQNTPSRRNFAIMDPPVIYSLAIPGVVDIPVCYVDELTITNRGNVREMMIDGVSRNIPEAYGISIKFRSLLMPTRNLMGATESGTTVQVIGNREDYKDNLFNKALDVGERVLTDPGSFLPSPGESGPLQPPSTPSTPPPLPVAPTLPPSTPPAPPLSPSAPILANTSNGPTDFAKAKADMAQIKEWTSPEVQTALDRWR